MTDEAALLATIASSPADATPRLVYADWLEDRGDPRAEFVRLQHQLAAALDRLQHLRSGQDPAWVEAVEVRRDVVLHGFAPDRLREVIKLVRLHTGLGLQQARAALARLPRGGISGPAVGAGGAVAAGVCSGGRSHHRAAWCGPRHRTRRCRCNVEFVRHKAEPGVARGRQVLTHFAAAELGRSAREVFGCQSSAIQSEL